MRGRVVFLCVNMRWSPNSFILALTTKDGGCPTAPLSGGPPQASDRSRPALGFAARRRKSRPDRVASGTIWPNGEFSLGYAVDEAADNSGIISKAGFGGDVSSLRSAVANLAGQPDTPLGLSLASNSHKTPDRPETYGRQGLTGYGRKMVKNAAYLLQERFGTRRMSFLTLTVPPLSEEALTAVGRNWGDLMRQLTQWLTRRLKRRGLPTITISVTELQPRRLRDGSRGCLHVHVTFVGRGPRKASWAVTPKRVRKWWCRALSRITGTRVWSDACENLKMVRSSAANYLGKYMSKGAGDVARFAAIAGWECVPRQWWNMSKAARDSVKQATVRGRAAGRALDDMVWAYFTGSCPQFPGVLFCFQLDAPGGPVTVGYSGRMRHDVAADIRALSRGLVK